MNSRTLKLAWGLPALAVATLLTVAPASPGVLPTSSEPSAAPVKGGVLPPGSRPYGKTYGQWAVAYWQWAMSIPFATNPWANDPTGAFAAIGQSGPVWFLGGSLGDSVTRDVTIPVGKAVLLPVHQWIFGAVAFDCDPSVPGVPCDVPTLQAAAAAAALAVDLMEVTIDGRVIPNVERFRTLSPSEFSVTIPADNFPTHFGSPVPAGTYSPQVADGYYLILTPLSVGQHTIALHVDSTLGFSYDHLYNITVAP